MGRQKSPKKIASDQLNDALYKVSKEKRKTFIEHFVRRAYASDVVAVALAKKILPDKMQNENIGKTNIFQLINQIQQDFSKNSSPSLVLDSGDGVDKR